MTSRMTSAKAPPLLTHLCLPSTVVAEHLLSAGFDGYVLDLQHGELDTAGALRILHTSSRTARSAYARLAGLDAAVIGRLLDSGCTGVIAPMVETPEQCRALVRACYYAPLGVRSYGPLRPRLYEGHEGYEGYEGDDFGDAANAAVAPIIQIESVRGVENADALLSVPGVRGVYLGPADLARSMGHGFGTDWADGPVREAMEHVAAVARRHGAEVGIFCAGPEYAAAAARWLPADFLALAGDLMFLNRAARRDLDGYRQAATHQETGERT